MEIDIKVIGYAITIFLAWTALLVGIIKVLFERSVKALEQRFESNESRITRLTERHEKLDKEYRELLAKLPMLFVQREDWIRFSTSIDTKLDWLRDKFIEAIKGTSNV